MCSEFFSMLERLNARCLFGAGKVEREVEGGGEGQEALPSANGENERGEGFEGVESEKQKGNKKGDKEVEGRRVVGNEGDEGKRKGKKVGVKSVEGLQKKSVENGGGVSTGKKRAKGKIVEMEGGPVAKKSSKEKKK